MLTSSSVIKLHVVVSEKGVPIHVPNSLINYFQLKLFTNEHERLIIP